MRFRRLFLGAVLSVAPLVGALGCSDDDSVDAAVTTFDAAVTVDARPATVDAAVDAGATPDSNVVVLP